MNNQVAVNKISDYLIMSTLTLLNCADFIITKQIISLKGYNAEANPLMYYLLVNTNSVYSILMFKMFILTFGIGIYVYLYKIQDFIILERYRICLRFINIIYFLVVLWGIIIYNSIT